MLQHVLLETKKEIRYKMLKAQTTMSKVRKLAANLADQAGIIIDTTLTKQHSVAKKEVAQTLSELNGCSSTLSLAIVDTYLEARDDLQSIRGPGGGISRKDQIKPQFTSFNAQKIIALVSESLSKMSPETMTKTRELTLQVAQKTNLPTNECHNYVIKYLRTRSDVQLSRGRNGGVLKLTPSPSSIAA
jgi:hypothetical protein